MTLVLPPRLSATATALRDAAHDRGLDSVQLPTFTVPAGFTGRHLYGDTHFADAVAAPLGIGLLEAPEDWLTRLPARFLLRDVVHLPIAEAYQLRRPSFIKSANDKSIRAMIYTDGSRLPGPDAVDPDVRVLVSDLVEFHTEVRLHLSTATSTPACSTASTARWRWAPPHLRRCGSPTTSWPPRRPPCRRRSSLTSA